MFLRQYHRTKACPELRRDGKRHTYFALVESHRTERGPWQRIVAQLGELTRDQQRCWQRTAVFHAWHKDGGKLPLFVDEGSAPPPPARHHTQKRRGNTFVLGLAGGSGVALV